MALRRAAGRVAPALLPFLLAIVLLAPATLGGKVLSAGDLPAHSPPFAAGNGTGLNPLQFDAAYVFEPDGLQVRQALRDFRLPVWTPHLSSGRPLLAAQQSAPLFPATWIGAVFPYYDSLAWIAVLKLALAALGTYVFARALGLRRGTALLGAIAFGFGTYLVVWLCTPTTTPTSCCPGCCWGPSGSSAGGRCVTARCSACSSDWPISAASPRAR